MDTNTLLQAYQHMMTAKAMATIYDDNRQICKYVHSTSRGHEAIQLATAYQLKPCDYISPYYRDESIMLGMGWQPYELMLQLLAKGNDYFTGGREYYNHPNSRKEEFPKIIHQSSATGMQAIPTTGIAQGIQYFEKLQSKTTELLEIQHSKFKIQNSVVVCCFGDGSITEGEVSEAFQFAALHQLPIIYLVEDNDWGISVTGDEARTTNAFEYIQGFKGIERLQVDGSDFEKSYDIMQTAFHFVRMHRKPILVHATVPLLGHHTSGVRKEWYRTEADLAKHYKNDPIPKLKNELLKKGIKEEQLLAIENEAIEKVKQDFERAIASPEPLAESFDKYVFAPTTITEEKGNRTPAQGEKVVMVDAALHAIEELMNKHKECIFFGQDVGKRLGGVFREAATLADKFGDDRVFNTAIQEAYIVGSTVGLSAVGVKPIVEVQFADYIYPGINQLVTEVSKSCYLSCGKFPVSMVLRVPIGAYGGGGPYHSGSVETMLANIKGIKVCYPSNAADLKGLMKAAYYDNNPVVMLEHKGLYWSKVPGTQDAMCIEPDEEYILPLGKGNIVVKASDEQIDNGNSCCVITYGMGVHWAKNAAVHFEQQVEVIDIRTLYPLDEELIFATVKKHGKCLVLTEETLRNSFAEALAGRIAKECFYQLDAPVQTLGSANLPAVPMNVILEQQMLPSEEKVKIALEKLLAF
jgi:2-oxoisovalerate dehydrogenase E1 component